ncbi:hypothetical protein A8F94_19660 [Bacillus sp. FJAT-27225]|uniref:hypothetical protein n=1 Tax=Bacillus sp. FJAT-27225 TaxID=1743144 RepID=UPI00080C2956|nr:hypothetical protein [Bacillus sp. FJAT-27225]OCA83317.1 hypothetical protein A8F94_19660 [Bacillus sp. FJAT-27225]
MKKTFLVLIVACMLSGFYGGYPEDADEKVKHGSSSAQSTIGLEEKPPIERLQEPGDSIMGGKGMLTMLAASPVYDLFLLGGLEFIVKDVKLMEFKPLRNEDGLPASELIFVKIDAEIVNQNPFPVKFNPIDKLIVNGRPLREKTELLHENMDGIIGGGETKIGSIGYLLPASDSYSIAARTSNVTDLNNNEITKATSFKVILNRQP